MLPTLGQIHWSYEQVQFGDPAAPGSLPDPLTESTGVASRWLTDAAYSTLGTWTFTRSLDILGGGTSAATRLVVDMITPRKDLVRAYFSVWAQSQPIGIWDDDNFGLPGFGDAGAARSVETFDCDGGGANCELIRSLDLNLNRIWDARLSIRSRLSVNRRWSSMLVTYQDDPDNSGSSTLR